MPGEFLDRVHNDIVFEHVLRDVSRLPELDPTLAFQSALPGFLGEITQTFGPWPGRDEKAWAIDGKGSIGVAIGPDEKTRIGGTSTKHVVAKRGFEVAGVAQRVGRQDFQYGGMQIENARRKALLPLRSFNERVSKSLMDVVTSGDFSGSVANDFTWSALSQDGETVNADIITDDANQVPDVYANDSQTILWPLRNGDEASANHDHIEDTGAAFALAGMRTSRDNLQEHPGVGRVHMYLGTTAAADARALAKTEYGAISERVPIIEQGQEQKGGFAYSEMLNFSFEGVTFSHAPDLPAATALSVPVGTKPFHAHIGAVGDGGQPLGAGAWSVRGDNEIGGITYGYRDYASLGMWNPIGAVFTEHAA